MKKKPKIVFKVNVFVVSKDGQRFVRVAKNLSIKEPVIYKEASIKTAILRQYPKLRKKLKDRGWVVEVVEWY